MKRISLISRTLFAVGAILAAFVACVLFEGIPMTKARPPATLTTIEDFRAWKQGEIKGQGTFQHAGATYTVHEASRWDADLHVGTYPALRAGLS